MSKIFLRLFVIIGSLTPVCYASGQDTAVILAQARSLEARFHDEDALSKYLSVLSLHPQNLEALCHASELYAVVGKHKEQKDAQKEYYLKANEYAKKALAIAPNNSEANFAMAVSMARIAQVSSTQEKIKAVKEIKRYADRCIQADPKNFKGYYLIGRWNYDVSDLNAVEKWFVKITYGALPPASLSAAIANYRKSMELNPGFILNYFELAKAYRRSDNIAAAKKLLLQMQSLPPSVSDDAKIKVLGQKMLDDL